MSHRNSRGAAIVASLSLALLATVSVAHANIVWGGWSVSTSVTPSQASLLTFNQANPIVVNEYGSIPTTTVTTQFATNLVNNVNGQQRVVMMLRYADGTVYSIVNPDANLAAQAASSTTTVQLTNSFFFATENGQEVLKQTIIVNGVTSSTTWGKSSSIVNAFKLPSGSARNIVWGGFALYEESQGNNN